MTANQATAIVAGIDVTTVNGHNLRALVLRLADADSLDGSGWPGWEAADRLGLYSCGALTTLGREVAELLRPQPWRVVAETRRGLFGFRVEISIDHGCSYRTMSEDAAERIVDLLNRDDLDKAKQYRSEPTS